MRRCEDEKMFLQTPTIGRTLRSDALGNNNKKKKKKHKNATKRCVVRWLQTAV